MLFYDAATVTTRKKTPEGYLQVSALAGRPGVQLYTPADFPKNELPDHIQGLTTIRILRPNAVVRDSAPSFKSKPITIEHPPEMVYAFNVKKYSVGIVDAVETLEGDKVKTDLLVQDKEAIDVIDAGKEQISLGYDANIDWTSGVDESHGSYDASFTSIAGNHLAIVDRARAGSAYRLFDSAKIEETNMAEIKDAEVIRENEQLKIAVKDAKTENEKLQTAVTDAESKLAEVAAELEATKKLVVTDAEIADKVEKAAAEKISVIDSARKAFADVEIEGKTTQEIRLQVIDHLTGGKSKPEGDSISAVYDALINMPVVKTESLQNAIGTPVKDSPVNDARAKMIARRGGKKEGK